MTLSYVYFTIVLNVMIYLLPWKLAAYYYSQETSTLKKVGLRLMTEKQSTIYFTARRPHDGLSRSEGYF